MHAIFKNMNYKNLLMKNMTLKIRTQLLTMVFS